MKLYIDQYGHKIFAKTAKSLCEQAGFTKAKKMFRDKNNGSTVHCGYVVGPLWFTAYTPWEQKQ